MKRYIALIVTSLFILGVVSFLFYILLSQDSQAYVTYIKFEVNPHFVIGINKKENVVFYNALNSDAGKYNLSMFQGKSLASSVDVFMNKLGNSKQNKDTIKITVMTKNKELESHIVEVICERIKNYDANYQIEIEEATRDEMERYSNEIIYNLPKSYQTNDLKRISKEIYDVVDKHVGNKIKSLNSKKLNSSQLMVLYNQYNNQKYFNDLNLNSIKLSVDKTTIGKNANYQVRFFLDEKEQVTYSIVLNLEINYEKKEEKSIVETYDYAYEIVDGVEKINHLKTYFYTF